MIILFLCLCSAIEGIAQGVLSGCVTDTKTKDPVPFANVIVLKDGKQVGTATTDLDGIYAIQSLTSDTYDVAIDCFGYSQFLRKDIKIKPSGFTALDAELTASNSAMKEHITASIDSLPHPLQKYKIVNRELKRLLDRVIEGKEHTYFWAMTPVKENPRPHGTTFNLYLLPHYVIDTTNLEEGIYRLHREDSTLPRPLKRDAPKFSFDSMSVVVQITTTPEPQTFVDAYGFVEYRGRIFFLCFPVDTNSPYLRGTSKEQLFKQITLPPWFRQDSPTWIYTMQQRHWYRWMELPFGY